MTTVANVINHALRDVGILAEGETASAAMMQDAYETLVMMFDLWQVDGLYVYALAESSFSPNGSVSYTVGALGTVAITRPPRIESAFYRLNSLDYPLKVINTFQEYETIGQKTQAGEPEYIHYRPSYSLGTLYVYPQPSTGTIHLVVPVPFTALTATTNTLSFPPQYILPIRYSLAELLGATPGAMVNPKLIGLAARARAIMKRNNVRIPELSMPAGIPYHHRSNILSG